MQNIKLIQNENEQKAYELIFMALSTGSDIKVTDEHIYFSSNDLSSEQVELLFTRPKDFKSTVGKYVFIPEDPNNKQTPGAMHTGDSTLNTLLSRSQIPVLPSNFLEHSKLVIQ